MKCVVPRDGRGYPLEVVFVTAAVLVYLPLRRRYAWTSIPALSQLSLLIAVTAVPFVAKVGYSRQG